MVGPIQRNYVKSSLFHDLKEKQLSEDSHSHDGTCVDTWGEPSAHTFTSTLTFFLKAASTDMNIHALITINVSKVICSSSAETGIKPGNQPTAEDRPS